MLKKNITVNSEPFNVNENEYLQKYNEEFNNLNILENLGVHERLISLLNEVSSLIKDPSICFYNITHGGYIPIKCSEKFKKIFAYSDIKNTVDDH